MKNIPNYISISRSIMVIALLIPKTFSAIQEGHFIRTRKI